MLVYWLLLANTCFFSLLHYGLKVKKAKRDQIFLICVSIPMILVMGFRGENVGVDTASFVKNFRIICGLKWSDFGVNDYSHGNAGHYEFGYYYLNKIIGTLTKDPRIFLLICAVIIIGCTCYAIYLLSDDICLSVLMYQSFGFYCYAIALMRQFIAISVLLISFYFFKNKSLKRAFLFVWIASLFHTTALVVCGVYLFLLMTEKMGHFYILITLGVCMALPILYQIIIRSVPRYQFYLTYRAAECVSSGLFALFILAMLWIPDILKHYSKRNKDKEKQYYIQLLIIGVAMNILSSKINMFGRIVYIFTIFLIFYIPYMFTCLTDHRNINIIKGFLYIAQVLYYYRFLYYSTASVCPYSFSF